MSIKVVIFNENVQETTFDEVQPMILAQHPNGIHDTLAGIVNEMGEQAEVSVTTLKDIEKGLSQEVLDKTDVVIWWSHVAHGEVPDHIVDNIYNRVMKGMGLIVLHSSHYSKIFKKLLGTTCDLRWRDDTYERLFCINPSHPIARGIPENFEVGMDECYGERFDIPDPDEIIFLGWYDIGEVFRSGITYKRGYGKIFYFQPGHETNAAYHNKYIRKIIKNAVEWAAPQQYRSELGSPQIEKLLEKIV